MHAREQAQRGVGLAAPFRGELEPRSRKKNVLEARSELRITNTVGNQQPRERQQHAFGFIQQDVGAGRVSGGSVHDLVSKESVGGVP